MLSLISFSNIHKIYHLGEQEIHALNGIDLTIKQGEFVAIVGPSGAGKTTLMDIIGLLDTPSSGHYILNGTDVSDLNDDRRSQLRNLELGFVFQSFFLLPHLTALQNVELPLNYRHMPRATMKQQAQAMLERVGLGDRLQHKPMELSGGQQQRVAIARALVTKPTLLLADEPTGALDSATSQGIIDLLRELNQQEHVTVMIVTHDNDIAQQCQRQIHLKDGKVAP